MIRFITLVMTLLLTTAGSPTRASTVWNPVSNGVVPPAAGDWGVAANWTNDLPSVVQDGKAQFNIADAAECIVSDAQACLQFVQGDNGPGGIIRVVGGGIVTTGANWSAVGYNDTAHMIVEFGGTVNFGGNLWVGLIAPSVGILDINGGTVNAAGQFGLGWQTGTGYVNVNSGVLNLAYWDATGSIQGASILNISNGTVTIGGDRRSDVDAYVAAGKITAFGGNGQIVVEYGAIPGKTTITAFLDGEAPTPNPATFDVVPITIGPDTITMTATVGSSENGPVEYYFTETTGNPGGVDSGWISSNSYTNTGLTANTAYAYTVRMRDAFKEGTASEEYSATTWSAATTTIVWDNYSTAADWGTNTNWTPYVSGSPDGNFKCVFNKANTAEAVVTGVHAFSQLVQGDNGAADAGVIRVVDGGRLTTGNVWSGIGYNRKARMVVEAGGEVNFGNHLWVGQNSGGVGILDLEGGTVNVAGSFSLGWNGGTGYANIRDGVLNLNRWAGVDAIKRGSQMDIEQGRVVIGGGDQTGIVDGHVKAGRITAFGGSGKVMYDYNITHPGKTTIRAIKGVDGDMNSDGGVNLDDLNLFALHWLAADCDSPANFDQWCLVDFRDLASLAANWGSGVAADWHVANTIYPTEDFIVTPYDARDLGIVADGVTDVTDAIQDALIRIDNLGGGTLFLPAGRYKVCGNLTIPARVMLRGDWQKPQPGNPAAGTILQAYAGRGDETAAPFIELSGSSGINGITVWYPEQTPGNIQPYPPTIHGGGNTVENVTFVNSYIGFTTYREGTTARPFVRNVYGTPLKTGIEYDCLADIGRIETVHFSPDYWADSGLADAPTAGQHETWIYNNGTGVTVRRIDWSYSCYVTVEGYSIGFALRPSRYDSKSPNGQSYAFELLGCRTGVYVEASAYAGYQFTRFNIQGAQTGVYLGTGSSETNMFHTCRINASGEAFFSDGTAKVMMMSCDIQQGTVDIDGGYLSVMNSEFSNTTGNHIELGSGILGAAILGNRFSGVARIVNQTSYPVHINHTPLAVDPLPDYTFRKPATAYRPVQSDLFIVTDAPYNAAADGITDDTAAFQAALAAAEDNGGGIVFVPGGTYRLNGSLTVPSGVELKGVFDCPHGTREKGSLLNVYAGRGNANGTPFIQLKPGSGVRGLNFHYPEQIYDETDLINYGMTPYPFLIRGLGADVYVVNIAATIPYQLLDLATYRCDRHYVDYIMATALKTGIHVGNGSSDGQIHNCQLNPSAYTHQGAYYDSIPFGTGENIHKILWRDATPYLFGSMTGQVLHENFVFGGAKGVHFVNEGGFGPSGYCMGMGVDQCTNALQVDDIGSGGLDMINSQIVTVNGISGRYLETGASLDDTFRMFGSAGWGMHQYSTVINGGDVRLQLFHLARDGEAGAFVVRNGASLQNLGGSLRDYLASGRPYLAIEATASAEFAGNIINTDPVQMPENTGNVTSIGNLRVQ